MGSVMVQGESWAREVLGGNDGCEWFLPSPAVSGQRYQVGQKICWAFP